MCGTGKIWEWLGGWGQINSISMFPPFQERQNAFSHKSCFRYVQPRNRHPDVFIDFLLKGNPFVSKFPILEAVTTILITSALVGISPSMVWVLVERHPATLTDN